MNYFYTHAIYHKIILYIIRLAVCVGVFAVIGFSHSVQASSVSIDTAVKTSYAYHSETSPTMVFVSDSVGYSFYIDSTGQAVYSKTTNGGASWGSAVVVDSQTDVVSVSVWYDQWTPGDTSGTKIYIATLDSGSDDTWYTELDTSSDTQTTTANVSGASQGGGAGAGATVTSITKATNGVIYLGANVYSDSFLLRCSSTCSSAGNWSEAGTIGIAANGWGDSVLFMPLADDDILGMWWDESVNRIYYREYEDATNAWQGSWTILVTVADNTSYDGAMAATVDVSTNDIYFTHVNDYLTMGEGDDDIKVYVYDGSSWTTKTDPVSNASQQGIADVSIAIDQNTQDLYVVYSAIEVESFAASANIYYRYSTDGGSTWSEQIGPLNNESNHDLGVSVNIMSEDRLFAMWFEEDLYDMVGATVIDLDSGTDMIYVDHSGSQTSTFSNNSTNNYIGAAFEFVRNTSSANITSITLTETGYIDADTHISNVDIYYETAGSCSYDGDETLFGTTSAFSSESVTVSGTMAVGTSQVCAYVLFDISSSGFGTFDIEINDPSTDIVVSSGSVVMESQVKLVDSSNIRTGDLDDPVTIDSSPSTTTGEFVGSNPTVVFTDDLTGYSFYVDSNGSCVYSKTTDGGATWSGASTVDSQTDCDGIAVWYDQWTPGDTSGTKIYIATWDIGGDYLWYTELDTSSDTVSTPTDASSFQGKGAVLVAVSAGAITKATNGVIYMGMIDWTQKYVIRCSSTCTSSGNWSEAGTDPFTAGSDYLMLMPLADGDILAIWFDTTAWDILSREYEDASNAWQGSWYTIEASADVYRRGSFPSNYSAVVDKSSGDIYLAFLKDAGVSLNSTIDDIDTYVYDGSSWTAKTEAITDDSRQILRISLAYDETNDEVYVIYVVAHDVQNYGANSIFYKKSDDGMSTWGSESESLNNNVNQEIYAIRTNFLDEDRSYLMWYDGFGNNVYGTTIVDITVASGSLTVDIVDAGGASVSSPVVSFPSLTFSFSSQDSTGTFGTSSEKIRVDNGTGTSTWTLSLAGSASTATFVGSSTGATYDFNDTSATSDGADSDSVPGILSVYPGTGTITPEGSCSATGVSLGGTSSFQEGVTDSVTLVSASGSADTDCYWDITGIDIVSQVPGEQEADTYSMDFTLSVIAS